MTVSKTRLHPTIALVVQTRHPNSVGHLKSPQTIKHLVLSALDDVRADDDRYLWMAHRNTIYLRNGSVPDVSTVLIPGVKALRMPQSMSEFREGSVIDFGITANLTKRVQGKRIGLTMDEARERLERDLAQSMTVTKLNVVPEHLSFQRSTGGTRRTVHLDNVRAQGSAIITDMEAFTSLYNEGIGTARGYGQGMLLASPRINDDHDLGFQ